MIHNLVSASADFDQNYEPISGAYPASTSSVYTVRAGDSLRSIAQGAWGDASLWYLIADANGLTLSSTLSAGQVLQIPNKVANFHNTSETFRVYNPGEAIGDALPTLPPEPALPLRASAANTHADGDLQAGLSDKRTLLFKKNLFLVKAGA